MKRHMIVWVVMALTSYQLHVCGQTVDWFTGGNTGLNPATSFLGCTDGVPINFRTNNLLRGRLFPTQTSNFNATYPTVQQDGFFAISTCPGQWQPQRRGFGGYALHTYFGDKCQCGPG